MPDISVIMARDRSGPDAQRAVASVLSQETQRSFELVVVGTSPPEVSDPRVRFIAMKDRNPARRRNVAVNASSGAHLAFLDDDAFAPQDWLERGSHWLDDGGVVAVGGPDPGPPGAPVPELISDVLLRTPHIGSGVLCHEGPPGTRRVTAPHQLALVNFFVRRDVFDACGGFDEQIGYVGEDTAFLSRVLSLGGAAVMYDGTLAVHHRRRAFPGPFLRQRWGYRVKMGRLIAAGHPAYRRNPKIWAFLAAPPAALALAISLPLLSPLLVALYAALVWALSLPVNRLPLRWSLLLPVFFAVHHACYWAGIVTGIITAPRRAVPLESGRADR